MIAVIDFGSQYAHLIANRIRRLKVYAEILLPETPLEELKKYKGIILSGGPQSVYGEGSATIDPGIFKLGVPILGVCYGHHLIAHLLGGKVESGMTKEYGLAQLSIKKSSGLFAGISGETQAWMSHGDTVTKIPPGFSIYGSTADCLTAAMGDAKRRIFAVQFHMEVKHTKKGLLMLDNFLKLCKVERTWSMQKFMKRKLEEVKKMIGERKVFLLVSGGVDSTVAYALLCKALGPERVYGLSIDTGLLRKDEAKKTDALLKRAGIKNFHIYDAKKEFLSALKGETDPEKKRAIIGTTFLEVQAKVAKKLKLNPDDWVLGQGTIYPDTIESKGTKHSDKIKTHHNRVPEILKLIEENKVIEPLAELYKDEVRALGSRLGLPDEAVWKHPFPGPGLGVRILCTKKAVPVPNQAELEKKINDHLASHGLRGVILPIQSVGVGGDSRSYKHPLVIWGKKQPWKKLETLSTALTNRFTDINRVCLLLHPQEIHSVKVRPGTLTAPRIALAQELDDIVVTFTKREKIEDKVWQFPTVLLPIEVNGEVKEGVVLRPICSDEAMTAHFYKMPLPLLEKCVKKLRQKASVVLYDITNKPPATIEWE
ncbi:glutamine-hydrolyzing GMP synthase [Candidatus Peregrinibacteria bacterium CG_4_9_14_0_2_um_filter_53_11]|nr:MAG: glutamine-hydrolyzing GMP synthase [Candidatus Peregrinibacteria bacterium CG_4_9_14_0_2_um_filter_53_11]